MCWKADRSVRAFQHLHSIFWALQHSWGPWLISAASVAWVSLCSFTVGLVSCLTLISFKATPAPGFSCMRIRSWWLLVGLKAQLWQDSRPALQGSKSMVVKRRVPGPVSLYTRCFATCSLFHVSLLAAFLLLFNTVSSPQSSSVRLLWMLNMPLIFRDNF